MDISPQPPTTEDGGARSAPRPREGANLVPGMAADGRLLARLSSRSALASDFQLLMGRAPGTSRGDFRRAVLEENCLARSSTSARAKLYGELNGRYLLDDQHPLFAAFLAEWRLLQDDQDRMQLVYVLFTLNDRTVAVTSCEWLFPHLRRSASELRVGDLESFYRSLGKHEHPEVSEWTVKTLTRVAQHYLASVRDFSFATGGTKKVAVRPSPRPASVRLILCALRLTGVSPFETVNHSIFKILGIAPGEVVDVLSDLNRQGSLKFRMQADVIELSF